MTWTPPASPARSRLWLGLCLILSGCGTADPTGPGPGSGTGATTTPGAATAPRGKAGADEKVQSLGSIEVTARLVEIPDGAIFERDLYHYATILKYEVVAVHRGQIAVGSVIYVGQYDPWKPRAEAADRQVKDVGGTLKRFEAGQLQRMALEPSIDDVYLGAIVDKYFGKRDGTAYWALWTNPAD